MWTAALLCRVCCMQANESSIAYLERVLAENGITVH